VVCALGNRSLWAAKPHDGLFQPDGAGTTCVPFGYGK